MAENSIIFRIKSFFTGEGMTKAATSAAKLAGTGQRATQALAQLGGTLTSVDGTVGKVAGGIAGLAGAFASGGVLGLAISGLMMELAALISKFKELQKAWDDLDAAEKTNIVTTEQIIGARMRLIESRRSMQENHQQIRDDIETQRAQVAAVKELTAAYVALSDATEKARSGGAMVEIQKLTNEFNERMRAAATELDEKVITAERDLAVAMQTGKNAIESAANAADIEREKRDGLVEQIADQEKVIGNLSALMKDSTKEEAQLAEMKKALAVQEENLKAAASKEELERLKAAEAEAAATDAVNKARDAANLEAEARKDAADAQKRRAAEIEREEKNLAEAEKIQDASNRAAAALERVAQIHLANADAIQKAQQAAQAGMAAENLYHTNINGTKYKFQTDENGNISSFTDFQRAMRYKGRADRTAANAANSAEGENAEMAAWADKMNERIADGKSISKRDQQRLDQWNAFRKQQGDAAKERAAAEQRQKQADALRNQAFKDVAEIKENLKKALAIN